MNKKQLEAEYKNRIFRATDYIESHIDKSFTLEELSAVAAFSKFHFNRIFKALIGESPFQYIQRIRLEKCAANMLSNPNDSITEIAFKWGFQDMSVFSRYFKNYFGVTASGFKKQKSNIGQAESNIYQSACTNTGYFCNDKPEKQRRKTMKQNKSTEVKEFPEMTVVYVRHIGPYKGNEELFSTLWDKLCTWATARDLMQQRDLKFLTVYHDDPNITEENKLRISVCMTVPPDTKTEGEFGKMKIDAGKYVVARFDLGPEDFTEAWDWVYGSWLPTSGYQPDDRPCFEIYPEEPKDGRFIVDICVPVKPM